MAREIPEVVRAAAGLAATVLDEVRKLPAALPGLPVRVIGLAMQKAMWLQQQYSGLVARGDELLTGIHGDQEPGLATFDDDEPLPEPSAGRGGYRESAFDRAADVVTEQGDGADYLADALPVEELDIDELTDEELAEPGVAPSALLDDEPAVEDVVAAEEVLEELAIEELVDDEVAGLPGDPSPVEVVAAIEEITAQVAEAQLPAAEPEPTVTEDAEALENALLEPDVAEIVEETVAEQATLPDVVAEVAEPGPDVETLVDVLTPDGDVEAVPATVTDEGVAAPMDAVATDAGTTDAGTTAVDGVRTDVAEDATSEDSGPIAAGATADADGAQSAAPTVEPEGGSELPGSPAAGTAPIEGYDDWSIAQLRGRLRGYAPSTVESLLAYEEATRAREPYVRMLRNRLERVQSESS